MLGQAHTLRRLTPLAALALAILVAPAIGGANSSQSQTNLRAQAAQLAAKQRAAVLGLYSLDQQLAAARAHLAALGVEQSRLRAERAVLGRQLAIARHDSKLAQRNLAGRLRTLYEQGNVEPLEILFGAKNLDDAITSIDSLNRVAAQDKTILRQVRTARTALGAASRTLAARADALRAATREAAATEASLAGAKAARSSYISSLASQRRLTEQQISTLVAQARAAQIRTQQLARVNVAAAAAAAPPPVAGPAPASSAPAPPTASGGRTLTVTATGYSLGGRTATGLPVGWGVAAVDPSVIPLGSHMTVPGYGEAVAADTGGAIVGATIDLWFPSNAQANAWGRRVVTIVIH